MKVYGNMKNTFKVLIVILWIFLIVPGCGESTSTTKDNFTSDPFKGKRDITIPTIDISGDKSRHTIIERGEKERQGHASTILLPDGRTMFVIWNKGHGGKCGPLKKSTDGGLSWSEKLPVPDNWALHANCPPLYYLEDPTSGESRLTTYVNRGPYGFKMYRSFSNDLGETWSPFEPVLLSGKEDTLVANVMPFTAIEPIEDGGKLLGVSNIRRPFEGGLTNIIVQSTSSDGGETWEHWRMLLDLGEGFILAEPELIRSPDGEQLLMLIRENNNDYNSWIMLSNNEGKTWGEPYQATASVTMHRHQATYAQDGRLVIVGRDVAPASPSNKHFVAWVGRYKDLVERTEGEYRIKLLHTYQTTEYPGLELLPDGTFVATNTLKYHPEESYSVVSTRFTLKEMDEMAKGGG